MLDVGIHYDVPAADYHADPCPTPSLSSGLARTILSRSITHAHLKHPRFNKTENHATPEMDFGSIVHAIMSGESNYEVGKFPDFKTNAAREWRDGVRAAGKTPVLAKELSEANIVAAALLARAAEGITNTPFRQDAKSEVTLVWKEDGVYCRARLDRLVVDGFADIWDWKTTSDCSPTAIRRTVEDHGYHIQAAFYLRGLAKLMPEYAGRLSFIFAFVEVDPPYTVQRVCLNGELMQIGNMEVDHAIKQWQRAMANKDFALPPTSTLTLEPSPWLSRRMTEGIL